MSKSLPADNALDNLSTIKVEALRLITLACAALSSEIEASQKVLKKAEARLDEVDEFIKNNGSKLSAGDAEMRCHEVFTCLNQFFSVGQDVGRAYLTPVLEKKDKFELKDITVMREILGFEMDENRNVLECAKDKIASVKSDFDNLSIGDDMGTSVVGLMSICKDLSDAYTYLTQYLAVDRGASKAFMAEILPLAIVSSSYANKVHATFR